MKYHIIQKGPCCAPHQSCNIEASYSTLYQSQQGQAAFASNLGL